MARLEAISISKIFDNGRIYCKALDDISIAIEEGEFVAITGASGSGKSTLLNILGGLDFPTQGCVWINGVNIVELSEEERTEFRLHNIGFVFQNYNLLPMINAFENITLPAKLMRRKIEINQVETLAKKLGIDNKLYYKPTELSGGQQQRVAIARALYTKPQILLADEPTGNLDTKSGMETIRIMKRMCDEYKQTMIIVTHDEKVAKVADRIIKMEDGKLVK